MTRTVKINNVEVRPGASWNLHFAGDWLRPVVTIHCISVAPERFIGKVALGNRLLFDTSPHETFDKAERAVRDELVERVRRALGN